MRTATGKAPSSRKELDALAARHPGRLTITHHFDVTGGFIEADAIRGHMGPRIDTACEVFICGPGPFMDLIEQTLHEHGIAPECIHIERFTPADTLPEPDADSRPDHGDG